MPRTEPCFFGLTIGSRYNAQYYPPERIAYDGILGDDVLSEFSAVWIDYKAHKVELQN